MTKYQKFIFNPLATLNSICPFLIIYLIKNKDMKFIFHIFNKEIWNLLINGLIILVSLFLFTGLILLLSKLLDSSSQIFEKNSISSAHETFIPAYLGFFFVALSVPDENYLTFGIVLFLILFFIYQTNGFFYNPLFILFGFKFYYISSENKKKILLITRRKDFNIISQDNYKKLFRINDFTFIDWEKY